jgi:hypothetical protein
MPCLGPVFVIYTEQTNSCILKVHYNTYQTQRVHSICQHAELDFYSASSLKQQSAGRYVAPLGHIILIPNQPVFALSP